MLRKGRGLLAHWLLADTGAVPIAAVTHLQRDSQRDTDTHEETQKER